MLLRPPRSTLTYTLFPYPPFFQSKISFRCSNEASLTGFDLVDERTSSGAVRDIFSRCFPVDLCSHAAAAFEIATDRLITIFKTATVGRSEEHTSELQSLMRISYAVFCLKKKKIH